MDTITATIDWPRVAPAKATRAQRKALYRFNVGRKLVAKLNREQAAELLSLLISWIGIN